MNTTTAELIDKYPDGFKKLGAIIYNLNRIEISVIVTLTVFFTDFTDAHSERTFIVNEALFDVNIFETFEQKRLLLVKIIEDMWRVAHEHNVHFDKDKWIEICKDIKAVQEVRNKLAHHPLGFLPSGKVSYHVKKKAKERVADRVAGVLGTMKAVEFDLDEEVSKSEKVCAEAEQLLDAFLNEAQHILSVTKAARHAKAKGHA